MELAHRISQDGLVGETCAEFERPRKELIETIELGPRCRGKREVAEYTHPFFLDRQWQLDDFGLSDVYFELVLEEAGLQLNQFLLALSLC